MRKCFNIAIAYLFMFMIDSCRSSKNHMLRAIKFNQLSFEEKKDYLKDFFEKRVCYIYDTLTEVLPGYEMCIKIGEITEQQKSDYEKYKLVLDVATCVKSAIDKSEGLSTNPATKIKCFMHEDSTPSMNYWPATHGFYCFGCSQNGEVVDIFNLVSLMNEWNGKGPLKFAEQMEYLARLFVDQSDGYKIENLFSNGDQSKYHTSYIPYTKEMNSVRHNKFLNLVSIKNDTLATAYLNSRGIDQDTAYRLSVMVQYPKDTEGQSYGRAYLTFINADGSYVRRLFKEDPILSSRCPWPANKWWNKKGIPMGIFNGQVIDHCRQFNETCFVCESAIDALSCEELGFHAIAVNGVENAKKFLDQIDLQNAVKYCCLSDTDNAGGIMAQSFIGKGLFVPQHYIGKDNDNFLKKYKDVNECMVADRDSTGYALAELSRQAQDFYGI